MPLNQESKPNLAFLPVSHMSSSFVEYPSQYDRFFKQEGERETGWVLGIFFFFAYFW